MEKKITGLGPDSLRAITLNTEQWYVERKTFGT